MAGFNVDEHNRLVESGVNTPQNFLESTVADLQAYVPVVYEVGINFIIILFVISVIGFGYAITIKNGQIMRWSASTMIFSFLTILLLKIGPIIMLTENTISIKLFVIDFITFISYVAKYVSIGMVLIGLYIHWFYKIHKHPDYYRWSRNLYWGSAITLLLSFIIPLVFVGI